MFCPQCQAEYRPGFIRCSDCDIELVDHLPSDAVNVHEGITFQEAENSDYVVVATVQGPLEDAQICSFLEANSIPTQIRSEGLPRKVYGLSNELGTMQILVPRELADDALDLLRKADRGELGIDDTNVEPSQE